MTVAIRPGKATVSVYIVMLPEAFDDRMYVVHANKSRTQYNGTHLSYFLSAGHPEEDLVVS